MKRTFSTAVLVLLLAVASNVCFAAWSVEPVSKEQAEALGMEIRSKAYGTNTVWVGLEFNIEGKLKSFSHVDLRISEGKQELVTAALREERSRPGHVAVSFTSDRAQLDKITLWVFVADMVLGGIIYELRVKEFVELEKVR